MSIQTVITDEMKSDILKLCEARDYAQFSELPSFVADPLFRLLESLSDKVGYTADILTDENINDIFITPISDCDHVFAYSEPAKYSRYDIYRCKRCGDQRYEQW